MLVPLVFLVSPLRAFCLYLPLENPGEFRKLGVAPFQMYSARRAQSIARSFLYEIQCIWIVFISFVIKNPPVCNAMESRFSLLKQLFGKYIFTLRHQSYYTAKCGFLEYTAKA